MKLKMIKKEKQKQGMKKKNELKKKNKHICKRIHKKPTDIHMQTYTVHEK